MHETGRHMPGIDLGDALRALPPLSPPHDLWPRLHARLPVARRRPHPFWWALAAALGLALLLPAWLAPGDDPSPAPVAGIPADDEPVALAALMHESAQLEAWLRFDAGTDVESAVHASLEVALRDRIAGIDRLLAGDEVEPAALVPLWQERVLRLRELVGLQNTRQLLAAHGDADLGAPVLTL